MSKDDPEATVTAGNASGQNDGAAICVVTHAEKAAELGLRPLGRLVAWAAAGVPPATMGIGPVPATERALKLAGLQMGDLGLIELNEAFAAQVLAVLREWQLPDGLDRVNVNGSGISLGPSGRRDRRADPRDAAARDGPPRGPLRPRDDVHRRRPGTGGRLRARRELTAFRDGRAPSLDFDCSAPVAQLDRASVYGTEGQRFESSRARARIFPWRGPGALPGRARRV